MLSEILGEESARFQRLLLVLLARTRGVPGDQMRHPVHPPDQMLYQELPARQPFETRAGTRSRETPLPRAGLLRAYPGYVTCQAAAEPGEIPVLQCSGYPGLGESA